MGKKTKIGKSRQDHFYALAKKQGLRARSAFKISQIAQKFKLFDNNVQYVIDLCAAPGGWMQIVRKALPMTGHVWGVDLVPIAPIKGCTGIVADITTNRCEKLLDKSLDEHNVPSRRVDLVLHDGAPNVGANWEKDAYVQNELVLKSLELAVRYLRQDGNFVTKVFRSVDYTKLMYVFQQLFRKVVATKPQSSRAVSAEIFVVCMGYVHPSKMSKSLFDINKVFEVVEAEPTTADKAAGALKEASEKAPISSGGLRAAMASLKKRKHRAGYEPGDDFRKCTAKQYFHSARPADILVLYNKIEFDSDDDFDKAIKDDPSTTAEILEACDDLKLCGKPIYQKLLNWRKRILEERQKALEATKQKQTAAISATSEGAVHDAVKIGAETDAQLDALIQKSAKSDLKKLRKQRAVLRKLQAKAKIAESVFDPQTTDPDIFGDGARSAKLLEEENPEVTWEEAWADDAVHFDQLGGPGAINIDGRNDMLPLGSDEEEEKTDEEDVDYVKLLEKELADYHKAKKEEEIRRGINPEKGKLKETRRRKLYKEWAAEMQGFVENLEARNYDRLAAKRRSEESSDDGDDDDDAEEEAEIERQIEHMKRREAAHETQGEIDTEAEIERANIVGDIGTIAASVAREVPQISSNAKLFFASKTFQGLAAGLDRSQKVIQTRARVDSVKTSASSKETQSGSGYNSESDDGQDGDDVRSVDSEGIRELPESELPKIPLSEHHRAKLKRKREAAKKEATEAKKARKEKELFAGLGERADDSVTASAPIKEVAVHRFSGLEVHESDDEDRQTESPSSLRKPETKQEIAEIQALGTLMTKKKTRMDLMDGMYNRWAFEDPEGLPEWFTEDDELARIPELPVSKELIEELKAKQREIAERPIRKVAEAKARKHQRVQRKMQALKKKAMNIADSADMGERSKAQAIEKLMKRARKGEKRKDKTYSIARPTGGGKTFSPKGKGAKGGSNVKLVDRRMKADKRGMKAARARKTRGGKGRR